MGRLDGKVAVIAGATGGIGWRAAGIFVAKGARIVIAGRRAPEREALAKEPGAACGPQMDHEATRLCHLAQGVRSGCGVIARTAGRDDIGRRLIAWRSGRGR
jgi:NAD(P)-dependent dehydrogenase (short-subunit alcohol dehydrogenase family)